METTINCCHCNKETFRPNQVDGWPKGWAFIATGAARWRCPECKPAKSGGYVSIPASQRMKQYR